MGHQFLRHIERTSILLHLIDVSGDDEQPLVDYQVLAAELAAYRKELLERTHLVILNKIDLVDEQRLAEVKALFAGLGIEVMAISRGNRRRPWNALKTTIGDLLATQRAQRGTMTFQVNKDDGLFYRQTLLTKPGGW